MKALWIIRFSNLFLPARFFYLLIIICLSVPTGGSVSAAEYHLNREKNRMVKFLSEAPFEDFEGITDKIDGYILWEGTGFGDQSNFEKSEFYLKSISFRMPPTKAQLLIWSRIQPGSILSPARDNFLFMELNERFRL